MRPIFRRLLRKLKQPFRALRFTHIRKEIDCDFEWYGNRYGGFYVNPSLIDQNGIVYSFGIGEDISFDEAIIKSHNCSVYGFDPTPKSIDWCNNSKLPENFYFYDFGIAKVTGKAVFNLPTNPNHVSGSLLNHSNVDSENQLEVETKSFQDICKLLKHQKIDVLKMDIEGTEYEVMENILQCNIDITQIVVEFHERFFENGKEKSKEIIQSLRNKGYGIFAVSKSFEEVSFIKLSSL